MYKPIKYLNKNRRKGVSGIMRVKNDAQFISASVDSCIDALDELIIVYNDCTDDSVEFINHKKEEYPDKIKVYEYKPKIYSVNLNKDEYDYAKKLPQDSEHLLANYYNFALSKISYLYALKIDADQIYFTEELKILCDIYRSSKKYFSWKVLPGMIIWLYFKVMKIIGNKLNIVLPIYPYKIGHYMFNLYTSFVKYAITHYDAQVSLSGLNVYCNTQNWYVTIGKCTKYINILPPYNGTGDHLIFKATDNTFYVPFDSESYNLQRSEKFTIIEHFQGDKFPLPIGVFWFHLNTIRPQARLKLDMAFKAYPEYFKEIDTFMNIKYQKNIEKIIDHKMCSANERALFQFLHISVSNNLIAKYLSRINQFL